MYFLASKSTICGMSFSDREISMGTISRSSNMPSTGIKSGIRSIGLNKYPIVMAIRSFAVKGVRVSL